MYAQLCCKNSLDFLFNPVYSLEKSKQNSRLPHVIYSPEAQWACFNIVQHLESLLCTSLWELNVQNLVPLHSRAVSYHSAGGHDVTITLLCVLVRICAILSRTEIVLWMKYANYALVARWLYLARRKKKDEILFIQGTIFLSIVFNLVNIRGVVQHKWLMVLIRAICSGFAPPLAPPVRMGFFFFFFFLLFFFFYLCIFYLCIEWKV